MQAALCSDSLRFRVFRGAKKACHRCAADERILEYSYVYVLAFLQSFFYFREVIKVNVVLFFESFEKASSEGLSPKKSDMLTLS